MRRRPAPPALSYTRFWRNLPVVFQPSLRFTHPTTLEPHPSATTRRRFSRKRFDARLQVITLSSERLSYVLIRMVWLGAGGRRDCRVGLHRRANVRPNAGTPVPQLPGLHLRIC